ncbi:hypothetical protein [Ornithinimicrobium flavum]|uniref:hypothetical protein n=1 Tax=Ornithinimicrobium flavum TaxID=1288636 RepID=UPI001EE8E473|nr:hypothetical protein [Ornithinimicrobium flavum]
MQLARQPEALSATARRTWASAILACRSSSSRARAARWRVTAETTPPISAMRTTAALAATPIAGSA